MKSSTYISAICVALMGITAVACSEYGKFKVNGKVEGAPDTTIKLQASRNGRWITIDSIKTDSDGKFSYKRQSPDYPEIFRWQLNKESIYFPIDSTDAISIDAKIVGNGSVTYTLSGSDDAQSMNSMDALVAEMAAADEGRKAEIKKELLRMLLANPSGNAAYYLLNKQVKGVPVYDLANPSDVRVYGAVANAYSESRPNDPRTPLIVAKYLQNRSLKSTTVTARDTIEANELRILEINLPDDKGVNQSLHEITSHGKVVLLNFTLVNAEESPILNKQLSDLYRKYKDKGFEIYQVAFDSDVAAWNLAAKNLPWITVYDESGINSRNILNYNVNVIPLSFIIDRSGEVSARVVDQSTLDAEIKKHI